MKKQFGLPLMLASVLAFSACSSEDVPSNGIKDINALADGGFVKMNINLPTRSASSLRANDNFNDGLADEYKVNDATLILFQGANEDDARFHSAYVISKNFDNNPDDPNQITQTEQLVKSVNGEQLPGNNLYALVVLNKNNVIEPQADHTLKVNGEEFFGNFAELKKTVVRGNVSSFNGNGFFMANAPLANVQGGTNNPASAEFQTLVKVTDNIFSTKEEAERKPAANIYVERGVAKVTMLGVTPSTLTDEVYNDGGAEKVSYTVDAWGLDNTNNTTFFEHIPNTSWNGLKSDYTTADDYRFIGHTPVEPAVALYRSYWGEDTNYGATANNVTSTDVDGLYGLQQNPETSATVDYSKLYTAFGTEKPLYCLENTFDVAHQNQSQTTRVIVRAKLSTPSIAGDFYTVNDTKSTIYSKENVEKMLKKAIFDNAQVQAAVVGNTFDAAQITVTLSDADPATNQVKLQDFDLNVAGVTIDQATKNAVVAAVNTQVPNIILYKNGYAYYPILIKHFGNQTPWNSNDAATGISDSNIYPATGAGQDANYLGRYGVLRNNWYELEVNSIRTIGSATIPERKDTPDDELNSYISVTINILSWAKRSQKENL